MPGRHSIYAAALLLAATLTGGCASMSRPADVAALEQEVTRTERAFAQTMADRDHEAFRSFLAEEAVFFSDEDVLRGKDAVAEAWKPSFEDAAAPFAWEPDQVTVLDSGTLALSTGPVYAPDGRLTGRFQSIWRRERNGEWRIVFDKGSPVCPRPARP